MMEADLAAVDTRQSLGVGGCGEDPCGRDILSAADKPLRGTQTTVRWTSIDVATRTDLRRLARPAHLELG